MRRRPLLAIIGGMTAAGSAGCPAGATERFDGSPDGEPRDDEDVTPRVADHTIETTTTDCLRDGAEQADVEFGTGAVTVDGRTAAPTPCHEATIEAAAVDTGELHLRIGVEPTDEVCIECVGAIAYAATITLEDGGGLDTVTVEHLGSGETYTVTRGDEAA